jgi:hypothetical protein
MGVPVVGLDLVGPSADALSKYMCHGQSSTCVGVKPTRKGHDRVLNDDDVVHLLKGAVEREGGQTAFANRRGIDRAMINMILNGKRPVSGPLVKALGLRKVYVAE